MTRQEAVEFINLTNGRIFSLQFTKRTDGSNRIINCRLGVTKHLRHGERAYDPESKGLIVVYDMHMKGYRSIPIEGITKVSLHSKWEEVR